MHSTSAATLPPLVCCDFHDDPTDILAHLKRWEGSYGKTVDGRTISAPQGWRLLPFGEVVPNVHRECDERGQWLPPRHQRSTVTPLFARPSRHVAVYAVPLESAADGGEGTAS